MPDTVVLDDGLVEEKEDDGLVEETEDDGDAVPKTAPPSAVLAVTPVIEGGMLAEMEVTVVVVDDGLAVPDNEFTPAVEALLLPPPAVGALFLRRVVVGDGSSFPPPEITTKPTTLITSAKIINATNGIINNICK